MAIKTYIGQDRETLYSMAIKLYNDPRGVSDILRLNPSLDLNATTYFGVSISYDDEIVYTPQVSSFQTAEIGRPDWSVMIGQSVYDLAIQLYGDIQKIGEVMKLIVPDINNPVPFSTKIAAKDTNNYLASTLFTQKIVATSLPIYPYAIMMENVGYVLQEDGSHILIEFNG